MTLPRVSSSSCILTQAICTSGVSTAVLAQNQNNRRSGTMIQNNSSADFWLAADAVAVVNQGIRLPAQSIFMVPSNQAFNAIQTSGSVQTLHVCEVVG